MWKLTGCTFMTPSMDKNMFVAVGWNIVGWNVWHRTHEHTNKKYITQGTRHKKIKNQTKYKNRRVLGPLE